MDEATGVGKKHADLCVPTLMLTRDHLPQEKALQPDDPMSHPTDVNQLLNLATLLFCKRPIGVATVAMNGSNNVASLSPRLI